MNLICFVGNKKNTIELPLMNMLSKCFNLFYFDKKHSTEFGKGESVVFFNSKEIKSLKANKLILVFDESSEIIIPNYICDNVIAIISSDCSNKTDELVKMNIPVITCGSRQNDTFTYSSCTEDRVVVSLQHSIHSMSDIVIRNNFV